MASPDIKILPFDPQTIQTIDLRPTLEQIYLPETVFADWALRTGENTFDAYYRVRDHHCDPLKTPQLRGTVNLVGSRVTNSYVIDAEDLQGRPPHTFGHLRNRSLFPGHMGVGSLIEGASFDRPMSLVEMESLVFTGPGQAGEHLLAAADFVDGPDGKRFVERGAVTINGRVHARGENLVFVPVSNPEGAFLPQFRLFEIAAQLAGGGLQSLIGSLPGGYAVIYDGVGSSNFIPDFSKPGDLLRGEITLFDLSRLGDGRFLFSLDENLFNGEKKIAVLEDISLGLVPMEVIELAISGALGGAS